MFTQRQAYVDRMEHWLSVAAACEASGSSAEARARARCRGGALDRAVCLDPEDVEVCAGVDCLMGCLACETHSSTAWDAVWVQVTMAL